MNSGNTLLSPITLQNNSPKQCCECIEMSDTLSLDMGNIQTFFQSQNDSTKLEVKCVAEREKKHINERFTPAEDRKGQNAN